jgi:hypothetical protein
VGKISPEHPNHCKPSGVKVPILPCGHTVMTSSLDLWGLVPYFALAWIASCLIHLAEFAYAEIKGRLPPRPVLFFARRCIRDGIAFTIVIIANEAYSRGLISLASLIVAIILTVLASYLIAGKTRP